MISKGIFFYLFSRFDCEQTYINSMGQLCTPKLISAVESVTSWC